MGDVLAVAKNHRVTASEAIGPQRVDQITAGLSTRAWNRYSAGEGAKGPREYERAGTDDQRGDQTLDFVDGDRDQVGLGGVVFGGGPGLVVVGVSAPRRPTRSLCPGAAGRSDPKSSLW